jgi:ankyrin repeat protein
VKKEMVQGAASNLGKTSFFGGVKNLFTSLLQKSQSSVVMKDSDLSDEDFEIIGEVQVSKISPESKLLENAREGRVECVKELIAQGVMVDFADEVGHTALLEAAREGHYEIVELLIQSGANVNAKTIGGSNAVTFACMNDDLKIINLLVANGSTANPSPLHGYSTLLGVGFFQQVDSKRYQNTVNHQASCTQDSLEITL